MVTKKAGCFLIKKETKEIALIYRKKHNDYSFPKGHLEKGETLVECAKREVLEETAYDVKLLKEDSIGSYEYDNKEGHIITYMYLFQSENPTKKIIKEEDREKMIWVPFEEVEDILSYQNLKDFWNSIKNNIKRLY